MKKFCITFIILLIILSNYSIVKISGNSMIPNYYNGQHVLIHKTKKVVRGDVIVFHYKDEKHIKRVIAKAGDTIKYKGNNLYVNNKYIEPLLKNQSNRQYSLKAKEIYVVGDNYPISFDSREHGVIKEKQIIGKIR